MADGRHFQKTVKSLYLNNPLIDFYVIWHAGADWHHTGSRSLKIPIFEKNKMAAATILKNHKKIAISQQWIDGSSGNLARLCKMGLLTVQTVEKFEFPKSKMADGRHFKNR